MRISTRTTGRIAAVLSACGMALAVASFCAALFETSSQHSINDDQFASTLARLDRAFPARAAADGPFDTLLGTLAASALEQRDETRAAIARVQKTRASERASGLLDDTALASDLSAVRRSIERPERRRSTTASMIFAGLAMMALMAALLTTAAIARRYAKERRLVATLVGRVAADLDRFGLDRLVRDAIYSERLKAHEVTTGAMVAPAPRATVFSAPPARSEGIPTNLDGIRIPDVLLRDRP